MAQRTIDFELIGKSSMTVTMRTAFTPKMGLIGALLSPMMKAQVTKAIIRLLEGNAAFVERGEEVKLAA